MNRRGPIVLQRSPKRRTRRTTQILLRGAARRAARVFKTRGLDLSGTRQRAGGVGGLLSVSDGRSIRFPAFDANGNASAWTVSPSEVVLTREYGPFGPISLADEPGFQTMPAVPALGSVEYLHRKWGAWIVAGRRRLYER